MKRWLVFGLLLLTGCGGGPGSEKETVRNAPVPEYKGKPVDEWVRELNNKNPRARKEAVQALGKIGTASDLAIPGLIAATKDPDAGVRNEAVDQLQKLGPAAKEAVPALIVTLKDSDPATRWDSCEALEAIGPAAKEAVPALIEALKDEVDNVRKHAAEALKKIDPEAAARAGVP